MIHFAWPWCFAVLPLPWLVRRWAPPAEPASRAALRIPFLDDFSAARPGGVRAARWALWLAALAWLALVAATARPQWVGRPVDLAVSGRDLMLAVDLSGSMQEQDFRLDGRMVDRLTAIKYVAGNFIKHRVGDRIGLILFGTRAYLQAPLTFDRTTVNRLLQESAIGLAGEQTAIGDAIGLAVKRLRKQPEHDRVLILLTDGANTTGEIDPLKAAELAAHYGVRIYTIGIGADEMEVRTLFGVQRVNPSTDLDEKALRAIAAKTGGRYFRASDERKLEQIYGELDKLEPVPQHGQRYRPVRSLYRWPLALALLIAGLLAVQALRGKLHA